MVEELVYQPDYGGGVGLLLSIWWRRWFTNLYVYGGGVGLLTCIW
jgi:hypothetical protein